MKVIVLFSGGLDSTTILASCLKQGHDVTALSFNYGQKHAIELEAARRLVAHYQVPHIEIAIDPQLLRGASALTSDSKCATSRSYAEITSGAVPSTYVPSRNLLFIAHAASIAERIEATQILIGSNGDDLGYPDCRPGFLEALNHCLRIGTACQNISVSAPLITLTKSKVIALAQSLGVPTHLTWSCYNPQDSAPCGVCDACILRSNLSKIE